MSTRRQLGPIPVFLVLMKTGTFCTELFGYHVHLNVDINQFCLSFASVTCSVNSMFEKPNLHLVTVSYLNYSFGLFLALVIRFNKFTSKVLTSFLPQTLFECYASLCCRYFPKRIASASKKNTGECVCVKMLRNALGLSLRMRV